MNVASETETVLFVRKGRHFRAEPQANGFWTVYWERRDYGALVDLFALGRTESLKQAKELATRTF